MSIAKRVLHIIPGYGGGISSLVRNIVVNADVNILNNDVVSFTEYPDFFIDEVKANKGVCYTLPSAKGKSITVCMKRFCEIIKHASYDAVHIHVYENQFVFFAVLCKVCGVKRIIAHAHITNSDHVNNRFYQLKMRFWRICENKLANQQASCSKMASEFIYGKKMVQENRIMHIPNGVNIEKFSVPIDEEQKEKLKKELHIEENTLVVGHVGFFGYQKNHEFMLKIIKELVNRHNKFVWIFIGDGWNRENIEKSAARMEINNNIRFLGRRNDVNALFQIMDVSVLPSHFEGLPTVAVESQAAGTPVVISDTVTQEVDLHMGLTRFVSLQAEIDEWVDAIMLIAKVDIEPLESRISTLEKLFFTAKSSTLLYQDFINGYINNYNIGDVYNLQGRK